MCTYSILFPKTQEISWPAIILRFQIAFFKKNIIKDNHDDGLSSVFPVRAPVLQLNHNTSSSVCRSPVEPRLKRFTKRTCNCTKQLLAEGSRLLFGFSLLVDRSACFLAIKCVSLYHVYIVKGCICPWCDVIV